MTREAGETREKLIDIICNVVSADANFDFGMLADAILAEMAGEWNAVERLAGAVEAFIAGADKDPAPAHCPDPPWLNEFRSAIRALRRPDSAPPAPSGDWNAACDAITLACRQASNVAFIAGVPNVAQALAGAADIAKGARRPDAAPAHPATPSVEEVARAIGPILKNWFGEELPRELLLDPICAAVLALFAKERS